MKSRFEKLCDHFIDHCTIHFSIPGIHAEIDAAMSLHQESWYSLTSCGHLARAMDRQMNEEPSATQLHLHLPRNEKTWSASWGIMSMLLPYACKSPQDEPSSLTPMLNPIEKCACQTRAPPLPFLASYRFSHVIASRHFMTSSSWTLVRGFVEVRHHGFLVAAFAFGFGREPRNHGLELFVGFFLAAKRISLSSLAGESDGSIIGLGQCVPMGTSMMPSIDGGGGGTAGAAGGAAASLRLGFDLLFFLPSPGGGIGGTSIATSSSLGSGIGHMCIVMVQSGSMTVSQTLGRMMSPLGPIRS